MLILQQNIDNVKIVALQDGIFSVDGTKKFVPFNPAVDDIDVRPHGSVFLSVTPFLVEKDNEVIILDTGLGTKNEQGEWKIVENLAKYGHRPEDVTKVIFSHLHKDHIKGLGAFDENGIFHYNFPNATHYYQGKEMEYAMSKGAPSFDIQTLQALKDRPGNVILDGDGEILPGITYQVTGGHTPFHQAIYLQEGEDKYLFGADEAPMLTQMRNRINAKYDYDGKKAMEWRKKWWENEGEDGWKFLFYHDPKVVIYSKK